MKSGLTVVRVLVDRSGSMSSIREATVSGINEFITAQKAQPGEAKIKVVQFDENSGHLTYDVILEGDLKSVSTITQDQFTPRGMTPLLDAMGRTIDELGTDLAKLPEGERPEKVVVVVVTDGMENASRKFKAEQIKSMVEHQTSKYNWSFTYIGANQDAILVGQSMGFDSMRSMTFSANSVNTKSAFLGASNLVSRVRGMSVEDVVNAGYTKEEREESLDPADKQ